MRERARDGVFLLGHIGSCVTAAIAERKDLQGARLTLSIEVGGRRRLPIEPAGGVAPAVCKRCISDV